MAREGEGAVLLGTKSFLVRSTDHVQPGGVALTLDRSAGRETKRGRAAHGPARYREENTRRVAGEGIMTKLHHKLASSSITRQAKSRASYPPLLPCISLESFLSLPRVAFILAPYEHISTSSKLCLLLAFATTKNHLHCLSHLWYQRAGTASVSART